ncbi:hypothetical protein Poli38472_012179 [Pythium oligandrum]|uniref:Uncharacterized protein n=1 Tax=Pythium oligandrum TaxID=41045 RepID=A0A8K1FQY7_PYTOL|nr:hypothetical protein Poli38472_012179 [Pythium oligandrum]|eukprot:TMW67063.1 hypothetical protein Poli38472_012179 [Pythium oligandrum]
MPAKRIPALEPVVAPLSADEKAARQRLHMRRTYYRRLNELQMMRDHLAQLKEKFDRLMLQKQQEERFSKIAGLPELVGSEKDMMELYTEVTEAKERLRRQNEAIQESLEEYQLCAYRVQDILDTDRVLTDTSSSSDETTPSAHDPLHSLTKPKLRALISPKACHIIGQRTFAELNRFRQSPHSVATGASVFGWRDKRIHGNDRVKYMLEKTFSDRTALELVLRCWGFASSSKRLQMLYSASMQASVTHIQRVDDHTMVHFLSISSHDGVPLVNSLFLASRFEIPNGYCLIMRSLDRDLLVSAPEHATWDDSYTWFTFEKIGKHGEHCKLGYGGELQSTVAAWSDSWLLEVLFFVLRWESRLFGPIFSLQC